MYVPGITVKHIGHEYPPSEAYDCMQYIIRIYHIHLMRNMLTYGYLLLNLVL